jgi:hypothetical protein
MRLLRAFIVFLLGSFCAYGQNLSKDFTSIVNKIDSTDEISIGVKINVYSNKGGSKIYSTSSSIEFSKKGAITHLGEMEYYKSKEYEVHIDHDEKQVLIQKLSKVNNQFSDLNLGEIKKYLKEEEDAVTKKKPIISMTSNSNGIKTYSMTNVEGYEEIIIELDMKEIKINKIIYEYSKTGSLKGQYCVLDYSKFDFKPAFSQGYFDKSKYFTVSNNQIKLVSKYNSYNLITE